MTYKQALDRLHARGYTASAPDVRTGQIRIWSPGGSEAVDVRVGQELEDFASGKATLDEIREHREAEVLSEP